MESKNLIQKLSSEQNNKSLWLLFILFFTMKKVNDFSMPLKKNSSGLVVKYFERKSTEG